MLRKIIVVEILLKFYSDAKILPQREKKNSDNASKEPALI